MAAASAEYVLAMKVTAGRNADRAGLPVLSDAAGVTSLAEVYALQRAAYPGGPYPHPRPSSIRASLD